MKTIANIINLKIPDELEPFVTKLTDISVPARYPDDLKWTLKNYDKSKTKKILTNSKQVLKWAKKELTQE